MHSKRLNMMIHQSQIIEDYSHLLYTNCRSLKQYQIILNADLRLADVYLTNYLIAHLLSLPYLVYYFSYYVVEKTKAELAIEAIEEKLKSFSLKNDEQSIQDAINVNI